MDAEFVKLFITIGLIPVGGFTVLWIVWAMVGGDLDTGVGAVALGVVLTMIAVAIWTDSYIVAAVIFLCFPSFMAFYPFAAGTLERHEMNSFYIKRLERSHDAIRKQPQNYPAYFELSRTLHEMGLEGHAIAIAERTLSSIPDEMDPIKNQSLRGMFLGEEVMIRKWKRELKDEKAMEPIRCTRCRHSNEPGLIACGNCQADFLVQIARGADIRPKILGRLVLSYIAVAIYFSGSAISSEYISPPYNYITIVAGLGVLGAVLHLLTNRKVDKG